MKYPKYSKMTKFLFYRYSPETPREGEPRSKSRPKNGFFCYAPFLGLIFWVTFCSNSNPLTLNSKVYIWNNFTGVKFIVN